MDETPSVISTPSEKESSRTYNCHRCNSNLDDGDIYEYFFEHYKKNHERALKSAQFYGWTETNRKHFLRSIIEQPPSGPQYTLCPDCGIKDPLTIL